MVMVNAMANIIPIHSINSVSYPFKYFITLTPAVMPAAMMSIITIGSFIFSNSLSANVFFFTALTLLQPYFFLFSIIDCAFNPLFGSTCSLSKISLLSWAYAFIPPPLSAYYFFKLFDKLGLKKAHA